MPQDTKYASIKVFKFDPAFDKEPRYEVFEVPCQGNSVLNALKTIYHEYDSSLAFRWGCEGAGDCRCGACAIMVNSKPALACRKVSDDKMTLEPHPKFEVIKDLVVDFSKPKKAPKLPPAVQIMIDNNVCVRCGDCISICPVGVYTTRKGEIRIEGSQFCMGETCKQCVTYCQANAIRIEGS
jgi:succinate dehydrogenase/fumarate reductase-like Fe-S protein